MNTYILPNLSSDRIDQMIYTAASYKQETRRPTGFEAFKQKLLVKSHRFFYGLSASAVTASCIGAFWLVPVLNPAADTALENTVSDYIMQDFLEEIS